jgi:hypothetical protein
MAHYKSTLNEIYWYDTDAEFNDFAPAGLTLITDVEAEAIRLSLIVPLTYQELRAAEYPSDRDYLDGIIKGDLAQQQVYINACLAVKAKYPKV